MTGVGVIHISRNRQGYFNFMNYKEFSVLYTAQLKIGKLLNELSEIQYPDHQFITPLNNQCEKISKELGDGYFEDAFWLIDPLSATEAYKIYLRQNQRL